MVLSEKTYDLIVLRRDLSSQSAAYAMPDRSFVGEIYSYLKYIQASGDDLCGIGDTERILSVISNKFSDANLCKVRVALDALIEHKLVSKSSDGKITVVPAETKVDLFTAPTLKYIADFL